MVTLFSNPMNSLLSLQQALSNAMTSNWFGSGISSGGGFPPINIFEVDDKYAVIAELPGVKRADIDIEVQRNRVRISGRKEVDYGDAVSVHRRERQAGDFDRTVTMPFEIDVDGVRAECRDGILSLLLPRAGQDKPRSINVA